MIPLCFYSTFIFNLSPHRDPALLQVHEQQEPNGSQVPHPHVSHDDRPKSRLKNPIPMERCPLQPCRLLYLLIPLHHLHDRLPHLHEVHSKLAKSYEVQVYRCPVYLPQYHIVLLIVSPTLALCIFGCFGVDYLWVDGYCVVFGWYVYLQLQEKYCYIFLYPQ